MREYLRPKRSALILCQVCMYCFLEVHEQKDTWQEESGVTQYQALMTSRTYKAKDVGCHRVPGEAMDPLTS